MYPFSAHRIFSTDNKILNVKAIQGLVVLCMHFKKIQIFYLCMSTGTMQVMVAMDNDVTDLKDLELPEEEVNT